MKPLVHLFIPQLIQPVKVWKQSFKVDINYRLLDSLLSRYDLNANGKSNNLETSLFNALSCSDIQEIPMGYYRYHSNIEASEKTLPQSSKQIVCADPIHLEAGMNDVTLTDVISDLTADETQEILNDLNKHFSQDGLEFIQDSNHFCYLVLPRNEDFISTPISYAFRKNIANFQPYSKTRNWRVIQNESQMILHNSDVNRQREIAGLPTVNSFWFWGGGRSADKLRKISDVYYATDTAENNAKIISYATNSNIAKLPGELSEISDGTSLIILDHLFQAAISDNIDLYQQQLVLLEEVIAPLEMLWQSGDIGILIDSCDGRLLNPIKPQAWKFWQKSQFPSLLQ